MNCDHVYARKLNGSRCCVKCTAPEPPIAEAVLRELNNGIRTINALHKDDKKFEITIVRGLDSGMTMFDITGYALDELLLRRERG